MLNAAKILVFGSGLVLAQAALAQESGVLDGLPAGVIIYDADPLPVVADVPLVESIAAPPVVTEPLVIETAPLVTDPVPTAPVIQSQASTRSIPLAVETLLPGQPIVLDQAAIASQVDLAPGETVLQVLAVPSIVKVPKAPLSEPIYTSTYTPAPNADPRVPPDPKIDPATGRLRDTAGWTGRSEGPASIGCFPAGACAGLNQR